MSAQAHTLDWSAVKVFAMDVDGILTDGTIYTHSDGTEAKRFSVLDGLGLARLRDSGIVLAWISGRHSDSTTVRAKELKIPHLVQGKIDKISGLKELLAELKVDPAHAVYMGDDVIDVDAIKYAGIGVSVPDAQEEALEAADYITTRRGGDGAVREVCNHIYKAITS
ncbi:KdsC family phosphatase [Pelagicoccus albus]|uniref:HAD hydrolase family protein n=1 Tax=Pelagicoccus albus TaxID=415222 RepID=A0A7X1B3P0_9BACT|nr:HAD hydrolase family protein [Pelagicoccus albus]MBC2605054.1 HAD hydrolase family protein [Pelagicoccus albus]